MTSIPKDLRPTAKRLRKLGWTIELQGNGHLRWTNPAGEIVVTGSTVSTDGAYHAKRKLKLLEQGRLPDYRQTPTRKTCANERNAL